VARAEQAKLASRERLVRLMGLPNGNPLKLPDRLPDLPATLATGSAAWVKALSLGGVIVTTVQTLTRAADVGAANPNPWACVIIDEAHHVPASTYTALLARLQWKCIYGLTATPDRADGMGCFDLGNGEIALVRNHELQPRHDAGGPIAKGFGKRNGAFVPGGTTTMPGSTPAAAGSRFGAGTGAAFGSTGTGALGSTN
jgi:hypothetical protein